MLFQKLEFLWWFVLYINIGFLPPLHIEYFKRQYLMVQTVFFFWVAEYKMSKDQMFPFTQVFVIFEKKYTVIKLKYDYITMKIKIIKEEIYYYPCSFVIQKCMIWSKSLMVYDRIMAKEPFFWIHPPLSWSVDLWSNVEVLRFSGLEQWDLRPISHCSWHFPNLLIGNFFTLSSSLPSLPSFFEQHFSSLSFSIYHNVSIFSLIWWDFRAETWY